MHLLRTHIFQTTAALALIFAIGLSIAAPYSNRLQKTAFVQWLDHNVVTGQSDEAESTFRQHIHQLPQNEESFNLFLLKVSELIASNLIDINIPSTGENEAPNQLGQWLVTQWTSQQKSMTDRDALLPEPRLPHLKWAVNSGSLAGAATLRPAADNPVHDLASVATGRLSGAVHSPAGTLTGSISINAP